jgi:chemotaxis protein MotC
VILIARIAAFAPILLFCLGARAASPDGPLADMVDALQRLQARIAAGDRAAYAAEPAQLRAIGEALDAAKPEAWKDANSTVAAIVYLLSGAQPRDVAKALQSGALPHAQDSLLRGALACVQGRQRDAAALIGGVDPRTLDLRIAGHFAYALGMIVAPASSPRAIALLDLARLLAPGGLVEETALRREILLAGEQKDAMLLAALSRQYLTRFGRSPYAGNFTSDFAATVVRLNLVQDRASLETFERSVRAMLPENRRGFLLALARGELESGRFELAGLAASDASRDPAGGGPDQARAQFYHAAALAMSECSDEGAAQLRDVAPARLDAGDRALLAAVRALAAHLHDTPRPPALAGESQPNDLAAATIARAESAIARTGALAASGASP